MVKKIVKEDVSAIAFWYHDYLKLRLFSWFIAKLIGMLVTVGSTNQFDNIGADFILHPYVICYYIIKTQLIQFGDSR